MSEAQAAGEGEGYHTPTHLFVKVDDMLSGECFLNIFGHLRLIVTLDAVSLELVCTMGERTSGESSTQSR